MCIKSSPKGGVLNYQINLVVRLKRGGNLITDSPCGWFGKRGKCKEKSASCAELINLIINLLQAVKIGCLTKVHIVGHKSTFRGPRKYILSATKVYGVKHGSMTRNDGW